VHAHGVAEPAGTVSATVDDPMRPAADSTAVPTWYGPEDRPLFGWVHVPAHPNGQGVVLCPSIGLEGEASQLAYRSLAHSLADSGCAVLRFDYHGTGDSTGLLDDPERLDEWLADVAAGLAYLRASGATLMHLVGTRLGATLAARAASQDGNVESLTLWYPWTKGSQFLRYQRALRRMYAIGAGIGTDNGSTEIPGFVLDAALTGDLMTLDTSRPELVLPKSVLVVDAADPETGQVVRGEFGPGWCVRRTGTGVDRLFGVELMRATVDQYDLDTIREFVLGSGPADGPVTIEPVVRTSARVAPPDAVAVTERPVTLGATGLFGILTEPSVAAGTARHHRFRTSRGPVPEFAAALFLNAGSLHHVGPGRQWVELSRRWAAQGIRCLRMDLGGIGDSPATGPPGELSSYPPGALDDVAEGIRFLAPDGPDDVLLLGLCSGAYHSLLAAPTTRVGGVAVLNPLRLPALDQGPGSMGDLIDGVHDEVAGVGADEVSPTPSAPKRRFLGSLRDRGGLTPITRRLPDRVWWAARIGRGGKDPVDSFRRVVDGGTSLFVVLGPDEWPGIGRGRVHELRQVARSGVFAIAYVPTLDHSFHVASGRRAALDALDLWVLGTAPAGGAPPAGTKTIT
jgi:alpha-beta hydrolase superfamily lysophospholipase